MIWPFVIAALALAVAGVSWWRVSVAKAAKLRLVSVETLGTEQLAALHQAAVAAAGTGAFAEAVELAGKTAPGPEGILVSPLSQTECVWHRQKVTRKYREVRHDSDGKRQVSTEEEVISDEKSSTPFYLVDAAGSVIIVPSQAPKGARKSVDRFDERGAETAGTQIKLGSIEFTLPRQTQDNDTLGYQYQEWVLTAGRDIFVQGEATDRSGRLEVKDPQGKAKLVISTKTEEELLEEEDGKIRTGTLISGIALAVAVAAAIVGVVLALT